MSEESKTSLDIREIERILPHRYPFLLIDRVIDLGSEKIVALKNVTINEPFFAGHFPGHPIMPGVLIIEAMAQTGAVMAMRAGGQSGFDPATQVVYFMAIDKAKFRKPVVPGDQLRLEVTPLRKGGAIWKMRGEAFVGTDLVCEAEFLATIAKNRRQRLVWLLSGITLAAWSFSAACSRRKPIQTEGGGPAVVVVERRGSADEASEREPNDDRAHAQSLPIGTSVRGDISHEKDVDFYALLPLFDGGAVGQLRIEVTPNATTDASLEVLEGAGKRVLFINDSGPGGREAIPNLAVLSGATYYVVIRRAFEPEERLGTTPAVSSYLLETRVEPAPGVSEVEPNGDVRHATVLTEIGDVTGYFGWRRDDDWLKLPSGLFAGKTLRIELGPLEGVAASIRVEDGPIMVAEGRGVRGGEIRMRNVHLDGSSEVYVVLRGREGHNDSTRWTLHMALDPVLDGLEQEPNNTVGTANPLSGTSAEISGYLWPGDADVYRLTDIPLGSWVDVEIEGVERVDLKLERLSPGGEVIGRAQSGTFGESELLRAVRGDGQPLLIRVSARSGDTIFDTPYHLIVRPAERSK